MKIFKNLKMTLSILFVGLISAVTLFGLSACGEDTHEHEFGAWTVTKAATCTEEGERVGTCSCGEQSTEKIAALGHDWQDNVLLAATCTTEGNEERRCQRCGLQEFNVTIPALGHDWDMEVLSDEDDHHYHVCKRDGSHISATDITAEQPLTCTDDHVISYHCEVCKQDFDIVVAEAQGHQPNGIIVADEETAKHHQNCTVCGEICEEVLCEFTHQISSVPSTCTEDGYFVMGCASCTNIANVKNEADPQKGHSYGTPEPFNKEIDGQIYHYHRQICENDHTHIIEEECSFSFRKVYPNCDYTDADDPSVGMGYDEHTCDACGYSYKDNEVARLEHDWDVWQHIPSTNQHKKVCKNNCGHDVTETCDYDSTPYAATCTKKAYTLKICKHCNDTFEEIDETSEELGHSWSYTKLDATTHYETCIRPNCGVQNLSSHSEEITGTRAATCTENTLNTYYCRDCESTYTREVENTALGHSWTAWKCISKGYHSHQCETCKEVVEEEHSFINSNICDREGCEFDGLNYVVEMIAGQPYYVVDGFTQKAKGALNVIIPETHTDYDTQLTYDVVAIEELGFYQSYSQNAYIQSVEIRGNKLKTIRQYAFTYNSKLTSVILPSSLEEIHRYAFRGCVALNSIQLPKLLKYIGSYAFLDTGIHNSWLSGTEDMLYLELSSDEEEGKLYHLIDARKTIGDSVVVRENTITICAGAFKGCVNMTSIELPTSLQRVGEDAFAGCTGLSTEGGKVIYDGNVAQWMQIHFENEEASPLHYTSELHVHITEDEVNLDLSTYNIDHIPAGVFSDDFESDDGHKLQSIKLPNTITYIGARAFMNCDALEKIEFADGANAITFIGEDAFVGTKLYNNWLSSNQDALYIGNGNCYLIAVNNEVLKKNGGNFTLADNVLVIADNAFKDCTELKSIAIGETSELRTIGDSAFYGCTNLTSIYIPKNMKKIGVWAFVNSGLTEAVFANQKNWLANSTDKGGGSVGRSPRLSNASDNAGYLTDSYINEWNYLG